MKALLGIACIYLASAVVSPGLLITFDDLKPVAGIGMALTGLSILRKTVPAQSIVSCHSGRKD